MVSTSMSYLSTASAGLLVIAAMLLVPIPTEAQSGDPQQCLSGEECRALRQTLRESRRELRPLRQEMRRLRIRIRETPAGEERDALIAQARELQREIRRVRRQRRPEVLRFREGCRRECFAG